MTDLRGMQLIAAQNRALLEEGKIESIKFV